MKPYIEYKNQKLEFEANFKLQKEFRKEYQNLVRNNKDILNQIDPNELNRLSKDIKAEKKKAEALGKKLTNEEIENLSYEFISKYPSLIKMSSFSNQEEMEELYEKYCEQMIESKYLDIKWEDVAETIVEEQGIGYYYALVEAIIKKVFSSVVEVAPQTKPSFDWNNPSKVN